ncbi:MAG TPA: acylneuraminate cytidylyltransferase family protein [Candidatus Paceibacterota bacterium]
MQVLALIPARGGSKGVPRKNIKLFCGKPLLAWTIEEVKKSKHAPRVVVSTDDAEIADIARQWGAEVPFMRPAEIAGDTTPDLPVFEHALAWLKEHEAYEPDLVLHLRPNSPLRTAADIDRGIELMLANPQADSARAVTKAPIHPLKTYTLQEDHTLAPFVPEEVFGIKEPFNLPWQQLPRAYTTGGYLSVIRPATIMAKHSICGGVMFGFEVDASNVVDIDTPMQFAFGEVIMEERLRSGK